MEEMLKELLEYVRNQAGQIAVLQETIADKDAQINALTAKVAELTARIEELTHKKNSKNSSTPPAAQRLDKPAPRSLRTKSGKKAGGQAGHKGAGMKIDRQPDKVIPHYPEQCMGCPHADQWHCAA